MKNRITRKTLRRAGFLEREARLSALPEAPAHDFSPAFAQAAASALAKGRRSALARDFANRALAAAAALILTLTAAVAAIPQARAEFLAWVKQDYHDSVIYRFYTNSYLTELPNYELTYIPEGFELIDSIENAERIYHVYYNEETCDGIMFSCVKYAEWSNLQILPGNASSLICERIEFNNIVADYYPAETEEDANTMVWMDENQQLVFIINSTLGTDDMILLAKSIVIK